MDSSKMIGKLPEVLNFNQLFLKLNRFIYHYIRQFETFSCVKLIYGPQQHGLMFGLSYLNHLDMNTRFKVFASYNILQYMCDLIHVFIFVVVSKCRKNPKLTNVVIDQVWLGID